MGFSTVLGIPQSAVDPWVLSDAVKLSINKRSMYGFLKGVQVHLGIRVSQVSTKIDWL